jgi:hypothetical protein
VRNPSRVLQPGMVVTLEPGLYVRRPRACPSASGTSASGSRTTPSSPRRLRADQPRRAGGRGRDRGADARLNGSDRQAGTTRDLH